MFGGIKDSLASGAAKALLAGRIERYGRLLDLRIRSREKTIAAVLMLAGESDEVRIEVGRYRVTESGGSCALVIEQLTASREWLQLLLEDLVLGKPIPLPTVATLAFGSPEV